MTTPAIDRMTRELIASVHSLKSMYADAAVAPFGRARARERVFALSEALADEMAAPIRIKPWNDHYKGNAG